MQKQRTRQRHDRSTGHVDYSILGSGLVLALSIGLLLIDMGGGLRYAGEFKPELWSVAIWLLAVVIFASSVVSVWRRGNRALALYYLARLLLVSAFSLYIAAGIFPGDMRALPVALIAILLLGAMGLSAYYLYTRW
jgi:hypothetical protein